MTFSRTLYTIFSTPPLYPLSKNVRENLEYITESDMDEDGEKFVECVTDIAIEAGIDDNVTCSETIPASEASYENIMVVVDRLESETGSILSEYYRDYKNIVYEQAKEYYADKEVEENV